MKEMRTVGNVARMLGRQIPGVSKKCIYSLRAPKTNNGFIAF